MKKYLPIVSLIIVLSVLIHRTASAQNWCGLQPDTHAVVPATPYKPLYQDNGQRAILTIPLIFHVFHSVDGTEMPVGQEYNLLPQKIAAVVNKMNLDYSGANPDTGLIYAPFKHLVADMEIRFCLAATDPAGNPLPEPGIHRVSCVTGNCNFSTFTDFNQIVSSVMTPYMWDQRRYFNIFVGPTGPTANIGAVAGVGNYPDSSGLAGIGVTNNFPAMDAVYVISGAMSPGSFVVTHEVGHALGLIHTFGDMGPCTSDYVNDTPTQEATPGICPTGAYVTCNNGPDGGMYNNFMDYAACQYFFTPDQKTRMQTTLLNSPRRRELPYSAVCTVVPHAPVANLTSGTAICRNMPVQFYDLSLYSPTSWNWQFPGGVPSSSTLQNPVVSYPANGNYSVTLIVSNPAGSDTITMTDIVQLDTAYMDLPAAWDFETGLPTGWFPHGILWYGNNWVNANVSAYGTGDSSSMLDRCRMQGWRSIKTDLSSLIHPMLSFDYAATHNLQLTTGGVTDSLYVEVSTDCGLHFQTVWGIGPAQMYTAPPTDSAQTVFVPQPSQWRHIDADLDAFGTEQDAVIRISATSQTEKFYIDNIQVRNNELFGLQESGQPDLSIYPNPSDGEFTLSLPDAAFWKDATLQVTDLNGRIVLYRTADATGEKYTLTLNETGIYIVTVRHPEYILTKKVIVLGNR